MNNTTEVPVEKTPAEIKKETAKANRVAAMARARAARKEKVVIKEVAIPVNTPMSKKISSDDDVRFFSETDLRTDGKGNITGRNCDYPQWYFPKMINDLKEEIRSKKFSLDSGRVSQSRLHDAKQSLATSEKQLVKLQESVPDFSKYKDTLAKMSDDLGKKLAERMPTRSEMQKGLADPQRMVSDDVTHCIDISDSPKIQRTADLNGFSVVKGKLRGGDAMKIWQLCRTATGESGNSEWLRKD